MGAGVNLPMILHAILFFSVVLLCHNCTELTLLDQAQVTLQLTVSLSDLV